MLSAHPTGLDNKWSGQHVQQATREDIAAIVEIHQAAFRNSFLTQLGAGFLRVYYQLIQKFNGGILLVSRGPSSAEGFVSGFIRPRDFYRLMLRNSWRFFIPALVALAWHPSLAGRVLYNLRRLVKTTPWSSPSVCELSSVAVRPTAVGRGIGKGLVRDFLDNARAMGADHVYLTTDAENNENTNAFYSSLGFRLCRTFRQHGRRLMNEYVMSPLFTPPGGQRVAAQHPGGQSI